MTPQPVSIHPDNPHRLLFRGKPLALVTASEHYGAVINRPFKFERYLADAAEKHMTLTRLFLLFRELQSSHNPYSTCKPESPDYIAPFARSGSGLALDGEPKFDLDRPNPEFYERLHRFISLASDYGIIVEVVLLSNTYGPEVWALNPFNSQNNMNSIEQIEWPDYLSRRHLLLWERQAAYVRKIVTELNPYDNIFYELCNEPGGDIPGKPVLHDAAGYPSMAEVNSWLKALMEIVRDTESALPNLHMVAGQEAFSYSTWEMPSRLAFNELPYDIVNVHPLPKTTYGGQSFELGRFMSKELKLRQVRDFCRAIYHEKKPVNLDEDNVASRWKDTLGWTIHRKRAWTALLSGAHYDMIDFSIQTHLETGTPEAQQGIRSWMKYLSEFVRSLDLVRLQPIENLLKAQPEHTLDVAAGIPGEMYAIYLADEREIEEGEGQPISGIVRLDLPEGKYHLACFDPQTGVYSPALAISGGPEVEFILPTIIHDLAVVITRLGL
jgi:hypothetical protein